MVKRSVCTLSLFLTVQRRIVVFTTGKYTYEVMIDRLNTYTYQQKAADKGDESECPNVPGDFLRTTKGILHSVAEVGVEGSTVSKPSQESLV